MACSVREDGNVAAGEGTVWTKEEGQRAEGLRAPGLGRVMAGGHQSCVCGSAPREGWAWHFKAGVR